jgi:hypothetical protein
VNESLIRLGRAHDGKVTMVKNRRWAVMVRIHINQSAWTKAMAMILPLKEPQEGTFRGIH